MRNYLQFQYVNNPAVLFYPDEREWMDAVGLIPKTDPR